MILRSFKAYIYCKKYKNNIYWEIYGLLHHNLGFGSRDQLLFIYQKKKKPIK